MMADSKAAFRAVDFDANLAVAQALVHRARSRGHGDPPIRCAGPHRCRAGVR